MIFGAIGDTSAIGVRVERIGGGRAGVAIGHAVAERGVRVGAVAIEAHLGAVEEAVVVAVGIERVDEPVAVGVLVPGRLETVDDAIVVTVRVEGIGAGEDLVVVAEPVAVAVVAGSVLGARRVGDERERGEPHLVGEGGGVLDGRRGGRLHGQDELTARSRRKRAEIPRHGVTDEHARRRSEHEGGARGERVRDHDLLCRPRPRVLVADGERDEARAGANRSHLADHEIRLGRLIRARRVEERLEEQPRALTVGVGADGQVGLVGVTAEVSDFAEEIAVRILANGVGDGAGAVEVAGEPHVVIAFHRAEGGDHGSARRLVTVAGRQRVRRLASADGAERTIELGEGQVGMFVLDVVGLRHDVEAVGGEEEPVRSGVLERVDGLALGEEVRGVLEERACLGHDLGLLLRVVDPPVHAHELAVLEGAVRLEERAVAVVGGGGPGDLIGVEQIRARVGPCDVAVGVGDRGGLEVVPGYVLVAVGEKRDRRRRDQIPRDVDGERARRFVNDGLGMCRDPREDDGDGSLRIGGIDHERPASVPVSGDDGRRVDVHRIRDEVGVTVGLAGFDGPTHGHPRLEQRVDEAERLEHAVVLVGGVHRDDEGSRREGVGAGGGVGGQQGAENEAREQSGETKHAGKQSNPRTTTNTGTF